MRSFPLVVVASLFLSLAPAAAWAQQIRCRPCGHPFGKVQIGSSLSFSFQFTNHGNKTLKISSKSLQGSAFSFGNFPIPTKIAPGASVQLPVTFMPTAKGYTDGIISLGSNDPHSPMSIHVAGYGFYTNGPELAVTPATLTFGNVTVGSSATLQATLTASNSAVTISSDQSTSSEFAIQGITLPVTIQAGTSLTFTIQFAPNASGGASGKAGFVSNAINSPTIVQLSGTGMVAGSHSVDLTWNAGDGNAVGYNVYRGTASGGPYQQINTALDASTDYTDGTVVAGTTYYYVATEVNSQGQESGYSNQTKAVVPSP